VRDTKMITVSNAENRDACDNICVTNEVKIPVPGEWSQTDEITRLGQSKPSPSPKGGVTRKDVERFVAK
jgi:hypothetical protein